MLRIPRSQISDQTVDSVEEGISFINQFGSGHSESIITRTNPMRKIP